MSSVWNGGKAARREEARMSRTPTSPQVQASAGEWLRVAFGDAVARDAMQLPTDLRVQLYGEVIRFGPAGVQVQAFFDAMKPLLAKFNVMDGPWRRILESMQEVDERLLLPSVFEASDGDSAVDSLITVFDDKAYAMAGFYETSECVRFLLIGALILTAPFYPVALARFVGLEADMNDVLGKLDLPLMAAAG